MNAGTAPSGIVIGQLTVRWQVDAELPEGSRARLGSLVSALCDGPLEDVLADAAGARHAEVCVRRVVVPAHHARWDCTDAELVSGWADAIGHAVRGTAVPGADVVRFASRAHARADLITSVLGGDRARVWAWRLLGLWPAGTWSDAEAVSRTVAAAADERPGALVALVIAAARAGQLGRFIECLGPAALAGLTHRAWLAASGTTRLRRRRPAGGEPASPRDAADATLIVRLVALLCQRSEILARTAGLPAPGRPAAGSDAPGRPHDTRSAAGSVAGTGPESLAESLAALALLEVEPAMAAHPDAWAVTRATARALLPAAADRLWPPSARPDVARHPDPAGEATPITAQAAVRPPAHHAVPGTPAPVGEPGGAAGQTAPPAGRGATPVLPGAMAATAWGGLLFLLPVVGELGIPAAVTAGTGDYGAGLRPVLHELGRQLLARAAPDAEPADVHDPALLAFCGLGPAAEAPQPPDQQAAGRIGLAAGSVLAALRARLPAPGRADPAVLLGVCRRHAVIEADPGWIDVGLRLDEVSVDVRRAGLDLDPGYLPWLGCVVRFRYA